MLESSSSLYERIGGSAPFDALVRAFYEGIRSDPVLLPMYPEDDLEGAIWRLSSFLQQYFGGPNAYSEQRGHPRLRMRHAAFKVNPDARERWLNHMRSALTTLELAPMDDDEMWDYFERAALSMVNTFED
ncbi:globin [Pontimonas sp.]|jgi:hemoglobin|nr:globin [Microbacteriaceae bacterium]MDA8777252.1 globin [Pontimonas sp.]MDA9787057.1 globin [Pontimonas sp.]